MVSYSDFEKILEDDTDGNPISWVGSPNYSNSVISFSFENNLPSYYGGTLYYNGGSYSGSFSEFQAYQQTVVTENLLTTSDHYRVSFSDVSNIQFLNTTGISAGDITLLNSDGVAGLPAFPPLAVAITPHETLWAEQAGDPCVFYRASLAKYAAAFFNISLSRVTLESSFFKRLISSDAGSVFIG